MVRQFSMVDKPNLDHERAYIVAEPSTREARRDLGNASCPAHCSNATRSCSCGKKEKNGATTQRNAQGAARWERRQELGSVLAVVRDALLGSGVRVVVARTQVTRRKDN